MNNQEVQKILKALDTNAELRKSILSDISTLSDGWEERIELCCQQWNSNLDDIIDILEDWAADYSATWTNFLCQEQDNEVIGYEIVYQNYLCQQENVTTTTSTTVITTTTTVDPDYEEWIITYSDYLCQQTDDPSVTTTTTIGEKDATIVFYATWENFLCELEDNPSIMTTTTTISGTTTTSTTVDPEDVEFIATWTNFQCELTENPLLTTTTSTTTINEDDVEWIVIYSDYLCQQEDVTTTSTTSTTSTTTSVPVTTTTTTSSDSCPVTKSGTSEYATEYNIDLGSTIGKVTLTIDAIEVPDRFVVEWNGSEVIDTGYRGDSSYQAVLYQNLILLGEPVALIEGAAGGSFTFNKTTADPVATVKVYAPIEETQWSFTLSCPVASLLVTTTTTTIAGYYTGEHTDYLCQLEDDGVSTTTASPTTTTTMPVTTTTTTIRENEIGCGETASGGTAYPLEVWITDMGAATGYVTLTYDMNEQPDKFIVEIDGLEVLNTGYRGDTSLQSALDAKLASYGLPSETISGNGTGTASFFKSSATTIAVVKVYAPLEETLWSFSVACPDGSTSTTSTSTTTTTSTSTTTVVPTTTTTTTNAAPLATNNSVSVSRLLDCGNTKQLVPADFTYTDSEGDELDRVRVNSLSLNGGTLTYGSSPVNAGKVMRVFGGSVGSFQKSLVFTPDSTNKSSHESTISFSVLTDSASSYSNTATLTIQNSECSVPLTGTSYGGFFTPSPADCSLISFPYTIIGISKATLVTRYLGSGFVAADVSQIKITQITGDTSDMSVKYDGTAVQVNDIIDFTAGYVYFVRDNIGADSKTINLYFQILVDGYSSYSDEVRYGYGMAGCVGYTTTTTVAPTTTTTVPVTTTTTT
jgi:hypothetical protein